MADDLIATARQAAANAYAPYSGFAVGCAVETRDGRVFTGANMENAAYGLGLCAEVGALMAATAAGALDRLVRVAVAGGRPQADGTLAPGEPVTPCGRCRQLLAEAANLGGHDLEVVTTSGDGSRLARTTISQLLPQAFGPAALAPTRPPRAAA